MSRIANVNAREIIDSHGNPTLEIDVITSDGILGRAVTPSIGYENGNNQTELRDNDTGRFFGKGVLRAVSNVKKVINEELSGTFISEQTLIDSLLIQLDGTPDKSNLGVNTILGVSYACARAAAQTFGQPVYRYIGGINANTLPIPIMNILKGAYDTTTSISDFKIMPIGAESFSESLRMGIEINQQLGIIIEQSNKCLKYSKSGAFSPEISSNIQGIEFILKAIEKAGYKPGEQIFIAINSNNSELYDTQKNIYGINSEKKEIGSEEIIEYWLKLCTQYPILSIRGGLHPGDKTGYSSLNTLLGNSIQIIENNYFLSNQTEQDKNEIFSNTVIIKPSQIGTLTELINTVNYAEYNGYTTILSHSEAETEDNILSDLSVALNFGFVDVGACTHAEATSKYNQFIRIEETLGTQARFGRFF